MIVFVIIYVTKLGYQLITTKRALVLYVLYNFTETFSSGSWKRLISFFPIETKYYLNTQLSICVIQDRKNLLQIDAIQAPSCREFDLFGKYILVCMSHCTLLEPNCVNCRPPATPPRPVEKKFFFFCYKGLISNCCLGNKSNFEKLKIN